MSGYREEGVKRYRDIPGTVVSVKEALELAFGAIGDPLNAAEVEALLDRINAENTAREDAREAWETDTVEVAGVALVVGSFYDLTEYAGSWGRAPGKERTARFCEYRYRKGFKGEGDHVTYHFARWGAEAGKKRAGLYGGTPSAESWTERKIVRLTPVEATPILIENARFVRLSHDERKAELEARDSQGVTPRAKA